MSAILGISAYYHDAAAALLIDGRIVAAAQEERFTRRKHDPRFPAHAVRWCLEHAGIEPGALDYVGFYEKPLLKFDRLLETYLAGAPLGFRAFAMGIPVWLKEKLHLPRAIRRGLGGQYRKGIVFAQHHESHAASAFYPSPFESAAILTLDGVGEWTTAAFGRGAGNRIELTHELRFPHSLGLLYSAFTYYCGFRVNSGEYKLMGLAPYGKPVYEQAIREKLLDLKDDGSFRLDLRYFDYVHGLTMTSPDFHALFGGPPRAPESPIEQRHMDLAASVQAVTETILLRAARHVHARTGEKNLCLAGGVALNAVAAGRLAREGPFERVWVQPASGDAGGALGVAQFIWHQLLDKPRVPQAGGAQGGSLLGPGYTSAQAEAALAGLGAKFTRFGDEASLLDAVASYLSAGKAVGWMQGRMEFGPRALGARSILADPRGEDVQSRINRKIKLRESFRPFAPAVLRAKAGAYFDVHGLADAPYMTFVVPVSAAQRIEEAGATQAAGFERLKVRRSNIPAVTHVDGSARLQTVDEARHGRFERLLRAFEARTGCCVLVNTSFNVRGEPIVRTPEEAYRCFLATDLDVLVVEDCVLRKEEQTGAKTFDLEAYLGNFERD